MDSNEGWSIDADLGVPPLEVRGWSVELVPWRSRTVDWDRFDAVYIGTPWDYPEDVESFMAVLERIDGSRAVLVNELRLVRWNVEKTYLRDLEERGAAIVPSRWCDDFDHRKLRRLFDELDTTRVVIKPVVSTNARDTFLVSRDATESKFDRRDPLAAAFRARPFIVQPFVEGIQSEGEYSLFYFGNELSHAILKSPRATDFRVQEEHGASILPVSPEPELVLAGDLVMELVRPVPAYARCDLVRGADGRFLLMELELIEPSLYLRMDPAAPERFAASLDRYVRARL